MMLAISQRPQDISEEVRRLCAGKFGRLHWVVLSSLGLNPSDLVHSPRELPVFRHACSLVGARWTGVDTDANVAIYIKPSENALLSQISKVKPGCRIIAYNDESDLDQLELRTFEMATVCFFDSDAQMVVRLFDHGDPKRKADYLHIEMSEHSDSSLALHASRIAALR